MDNFEENQKVRYLVVIRSYLLKKSEGNLDMDVRIFQQVIKNVNIFISHGLAVRKGYLNC